MSEPGHLAGSFLEPLHLLRCSVPFPRCSGAYWAELSIIQPWEIKGHRTPGGFEWFAPGDRSGQHSCHGARCLICGRWPLTAWLMPWPYATSCFYQTQHTEIQRAWLWQTDTRFSGRRFHYYRLFYAFVWRWHCNLWICRRTPVLHIIAAVTYDWWDKFWIHPKT